jgi:hypothetical protein
MSDIYLSLTETPSVVTLSQPVVASVMVNTVTVANVVSVNVVTMPAINVTAAGGLTNAELRASAVSVAVTTMPALSISSVSISNFPASQTINGAVTVGSVPPIQWSNANAGNAPTTVNQNAPLPVQLYVGAVPTSVTLGATITNSVTIGSLPAISGTVTANAGNFAYSESQELIGANDKAVLIGFEDDASSEFRRVTDAQPLPVNINAIGTASISGTVTANTSEAVSIVNTTTVTKADAKFTLIAGSSNPTDVAQSYQVTPLDVDIKGVAFVDGKVVSHRSSCVAELTGQGGPAWKATLVASSVTVSNSVTIGSLPTLTPQLPRVTFIDGSGTVVTANSAVTLFASSSTRSYLLVQVTTGSAFVNVGATATTVNGINLTAGQGYAWETTIPQGLVSLISTTTSSRWVAKEA